MEICARVYRPRRARESPLFRLVEQHLEEFLRVYEERSTHVRRAAAVRTISTEIAGPPPQSPTMPGTCGYTEKAS